MFSFNIKKFISISAIAIVMVLGVSQATNAQGNWGHNQDKRAIKQQQKIAKERAKLEQERLRLERQRALEAQRNQDRNRRDANNWNNNGQYNSNGRYRVVRNGRTYNTDGRGAELLRQAVNQGYQQGYAVGQSDRNSRRRSSYSNQTMYKNGNYGYQTNVDRSQYQYYFQQGFQKGYDDGYNTRNRYGTSNGGNVNILSAILGSILNIRSY